MDTKQKRAGVAILCIVLVGILTTGAKLAAAADKEQTNEPKSKNVTNYIAVAEENVVETPESKAEAFAVYGQYGLTYNKNTDQLFYNEKLVRYFEDYYPVGDGASIEKSFFNENGIIDVHGIRDLSQLTLNPDGSTDPSGKLIGVEAYSQAEFEARDIEELKNPPMQATAVESGPELTPDELAKLYSVYEPFGVTYDKKKDCFYYDGKLVRQFVDILSSNGEPLSGGKFKGSMRQMGSPDGEIEIEAVRDYTKPDTNGYGALIGIVVVK
jgi:hypothetical protein